MPRRRRRPLEPPIFAPRPVPGARGYCPTAALEREWIDGAARRVWRLGPAIVSLEAADGQVWKAAERLPLPRERDAALQDLANRGIDHPSSWASVFWAVCSARWPRVRHTFNGLLDWWTVGPWSEALRIGRLRAPYARYDLVSAYRWAGECGLPDRATFGIRTDPGRGWPGVWIARTCDDRPDLPPPYRERDRTVVVTSEEIAEWRLRVQYQRGVTWRRVDRADWIGRTLDRLPDWAQKPAGRSYWGRWIASDPLVCETRRTAWELPALWRCTVWALLIMARVRLAVWRATTVGRPAHVYVDEIVTDAEIPTGTAPGEWRRRTGFPRGLHVHRTGWYGPVDGKPIMRTGVPASATTTPRG